MLRVAFDVDGVLADFQTGFRQAAVEITGRGGLAPQEPEQPPRGLSARQVNRVWEHISRTPQWWLTLHAYEPDEIVRLYRTMRERRWEVYFVTTRPPSAGETTQFQTQWWLESQGFQFPAVMTVPGSRGELANALHLDALIDDRLMNCLEVIGGSRAKAIHVLRENDVAAREQALQSGIAVVGTLRDAIDTLLQLETAMRGSRGRITRLVEWFKTSPPDERLPLNPRDSLPLRPKETD
jgi:hypothetical protein